MDALSFAWSATVKDLLRRMRDPFALLLWIGIPIAIGGLIVLAMGGSSGPAPKAVLLVVDHDESFASQALVSVLSSKQAGVIEARVLDETQARAELDAGDASGLIVIPTGFGEALFDELPLTLEVRTNPAQRILPGIIEQMLTMVREAVFYAHRVLGDELRALVAGARSGGVVEELRMAEAAVAVRRDMERIGKYVFPPVISVESSVRASAGEVRPQRSLASFYLPSMLLMALMFMAEGLADDVWRERAVGAWRRACVGPLGLRPVLAGKLLASWLTMLFVATIACALACVTFDLDPARMAIAALWASATGLVLHLGMLLIKLCASSQRGAGLIGNLVLFPLLMVGGSFIPFEAMPTWLANIGKLTPNGWSLARLNALIFEGVEFGALVSGGLGLALCGALLYGVCAWRLERFARA